MRRTFEWLVARPFCLAPVMAVLSLVSFCGAFTLTGEGPTKNLRFSILISVVYGIALTLGVSRLRRRAGAPNDF